MMKKINNLFEVNSSDTIGTALLKGVTKGYLQGVVAAGVGLGALAVGVMILSNNDESEEVKEEELDLDGEPYFEDVNGVKKEVVGK